MADDAAGADAGAGFDGVLHTPFIKVDRPRPGAASSFVFTRQKDFETNDQPFNRERKKARKTDKKKQTGVPQPKGWDYTSILDDKATQAWLKQFDDHFKKGQKFWLDIAAEITAFSNSMHESMKELAENDDIKMQDIRVMSPDIINLLMAYKVIGAICEELELDFQGALNWILERKGARNKDGLSQLHQILGLRESEKG